MAGYFIGLSAPSVTEASTTRLASPRSNSAGQTRLPTFSTSTTDPAGGSSAASPRLTISASRWQPAPVLICTTRQPGRPDPVRVERGLLVALDHGQAEPARQVGGGPLQQRGLARARRAHQVQHGHAAPGQPVPVHARPVRRSWPAPSPAARPCGSRRAGVRARGRAVPVARAQGQHCARARRCRRIRRSRTFLSPPSFRSLVRSRRPRGRLPRPRRSSGPGLRSPARPRCRSRTAGSASRARTRRRRCGTGTWPAAR